MNNLIDILKEKGIDFEIIKHDKTIYSAKEGAEYFGISVGQTAPILIISTSKGFYSLIVSGSRGKVDFAEIENKFGLNSVRMASKREVEKVTGFFAGAIPLIGLSLPCIVDTQLFEYESIYGGTGIANCTLKLNPNALIKVNDVIGML